MSDFHGIIFAYGAVPELGELVRRRTASSLMCQPRRRRTSTAVRATAALRSWCAPNRGRCNDRYAPKWNT